MSSIKYIIGQYSRVNSFIRSRGCAALDRINEFTREYCPITYTYSVRPEAFTDALQTLNDGYNLILPKTYTYSLSMLVLKNLLVLIASSFIYIIN